MTFVMGGVLTLAPGSDRIPVELFQILTQYAICRLPALLPFSHSSPLSLYLYSPKLDLSCPLKLQSEGMSDWPVTHLNGRQYLEGFGG